MSDDLWSLERTQHITRLAEQNGMDIWLDNFETLAVTISQRRMTTDQRERLYGLLERIYADARTRRRRKAA